MPGDSAPHLEITSAASPAGPVVRLDGDLDAATAPRIDVLEPRGEPGQVLRLELGGLSFLDSSGLRSLLALRQRAAASGLELRVSEPTSIVVRLLEVTGLADLFPLADDPDPFR